LLTIQESIRKNSTLGSLEERKVTRKRTVVQEELGVSLDVIVRDTRCVQADCTPPQAHANV
jgi:hypothetical protein